VHDYDPWKYIILIRGYFLQKVLCELYPLRLEQSIFMDSDFELPGFPIIKMGILFWMQTKLVNRLSIKAELKAIFSSGDLN
jgi:hypothetical protein